MKIFWKAWGVTELVPLFLWFQHCHSMYLLCAQCHGHVPSNHLQNLIRRYEICCDLTHSFLLLFVTLTFDVAFFPLFRQSRSHSKKWRATLSFLFRPLSPTFSPLSFSLSSFFTDSRNLQSTQSMVHKCGAQRDACMQQIEESWHLFCFFSSSSGFPLPWSLVLLSEWRTKVGLCRWRPRGGNGIVNQASWLPFAFTPSVCISWNYL